MLRITFKLLLAYFLIAVCLVTPAYSQKVWEKKPYTEWSQSEVLGILADSPWAQTRIEHNTFSVTIRLRSALPIRQALIRQKQIQLNYDRFTPTDKARFDAEVKKYLECSDCAKYYIVTLSSMFNDSYALRAIEGLSLDELKPHVILGNDKGERRGLVGFIPPKGESGEAMFVFDRFDAHGKPLLTLDNKRLYFKIEDKVFEGSTLIPIKKFTFEVSKLIQHGEVVF